MRIDRRLFVTALVSSSLASLSSGCREEGVRRYQVARSTSSRLAPVTFQTPAGWRELFDPGAMRVAAFRIEDGVNRAEVSITKLPGPAGGVLDNVNRWRGQINLKPVTEEQLKPDLREMVVSGTPSKFVELIGTADKNEPAQRTLGVIIPRGEQTWFIKMMGPDELVARQRPAFDSFVASVTINDAH